MTGPSGLTTQVPVQTKRCLLEIRRIISSNCTDLDSQIPSNTNHQILQMQTLQFHLHSLLHRDLTHINPTPCAYSGANEDLGTTTIRSSQELQTNQASLGCMHVIYTMVCHSFSTIALKSNPTLKERIVGTPSFCALLCNRV